MTENIDSESFAPGNKSKSISRWVIVGVLIFLLFGLVVWYQIMLINKQKDIIGKLSTISPTLPLISPTTSQEIMDEEPYVVIFPQNYLAESEGTVRIEEEYDYFTNKNFILVLTLDSENILNQDKTDWLPGKEHKYAIQLNDSVDSVAEPLIAPNHKYGCVTLQASGYVGSYVFELESGEGLDQGVQYSKCVEWIDQHRVIIWEHVYNTPKVTYYIFDASTKKSTILSQFQRSD